MRDWIAGWLILCGLLTLAWVTAAECAQKQRERDKARRALTAQPPAVGYWTDTAEGHPHPRRERTFHLEAASDDEAWRAISARAS